MLATIATGHVDLADVLFLIAFILAVIAAVLTLATMPFSRFAQMLGYLAIAGLALAFLVL